ncbi:hypothetical protein [Pseudenterobacter timonensis]|uniref:Uncharacterized protein n=1 Tax=Pseudenterobacter timonensis TaxID=1755099 RepID=A0ABV4A4F3_9ENTR
MTMTVQVRFTSVKKMCHSGDASRKVRIAPSTQLPSTWKLSPQQQAFIDLFADDEPKKQ